MADVIDTSRTLRSTTTGHAIFLQTSFDARILRAIVIFLSLLFSSYSLSLSLSLSLMRNNDRNDDDDNDDDEKELL